MIKVYLVFLNPKPIEATSVSWTWFDFYNAKQFLINPSSFTDPGHPGTPIYYIYYIILSLLGPEIKNFQKFIYINHLLYFFLYYFCFQYFFKYFKEKIDISLIIAFFLLLFSYQISFVYLEVVSNSVYILPLSLVLITQSFKINQNANLKIIIKFTFIVSFALSTKFVLLPFICILYLALIQSFIEQKKTIIFFLITNFLIILFFVILNFPILGRIPASIFLILFERADTSIAISESWDAIKTGIATLNNENSLMIISIIIFFIGNIFFLLKNILEKNIKNHLIILNIFFLVFFLYTFVASGQQIKSSYLYTFARDIDMDILFRNNFPYFFFIFLFFLQLKNAYRNLKQLLLTLSILIFIFSFYHYNFYRQNNILQSSNYSNELKQKLSKYIDVNNDYFAYWSTYKKYGINEEIIHFKGNYVWGNEKFNKEIINFFPNIRLLRMNDIVNKINQKEIINNTSTSNLFKKKIKDNFIPVYENFIKENFNTFFYNSLSTRSFKNLSIPLGDSRRSEEIYSGQETLPLKLKLLAFTFPKNPKIFKNNHGNIINFIEKTIVIKEIIIENVYEDKWYFLLVKD